MRKKSFYIGPNKAFELYLWTQTDAVAGVRKMARVYRKIADEQYNYIDDYLTMNISELENRGACSQIK